MEIRFFTLSQVTDRISQIFAPISTKEFWVKAEMSNSRLRGGHLYLDLVETDSYNNQIAKISCTIWASKLSVIKQRFETSGLEFNPENGLQIGLLCSINYHKLYGISLQAKDADPSVTMGMMELEKQRIINSLNKEQLFELNKNVYLPPLPNKIGLITGDKSAALADFTQTIANSPFGITIYFADSHMQGKQAESSILKALMLFDNSFIDLVVIIRGGGSKSDLYSLDNEKIARRIASMKKPVWTGIGHEIDISVLDYVSNKYFKTPTAVAEEIVNSYKIFSAKLHDARYTFQTVWNKMLTKEKEFIDREVIGIKQGTRKLFEINYSSLKANRHSLSNKVNSRIGAENKNLFRLISQLSSSANQLTFNLKSDNLLYANKIISCSKNFLSLKNNLLIYNKSRFSLSRYLSLINHNKDRVRNYYSWLNGRSQKNINSSKKSLNIILNRFTPKLFLKPLFNQMDILAKQNQLLNSYNPHNLLKKGYSIITDTEGKIIKSFNQIHVGDIFIAELNDGNLKSKVINKENKIHGGKANDV